MSLCPAEVCLRNGEKTTTSVKIEVEGAAPIDIPQSNLRLPVPLIHDLIEFSGDDTVPMFLSKLLEQYRTKCAEERGPKRDPIQIAKTMRCPDCDGDLLKSRAGEFGKCIICGALYRLDQDKGDKLIATIKLLNCPDCGATGSILLLKTREGDKASKYGKCYKCGTEYRLDQRGNFYHG